MILKFNTKLGLFFPRVFCAVFDLFLFASPTVVVSPVDR
jgi:hypothetical protein